MERQPLIVEVLRGTRVESRHRVRACIADPTGRIVQAHGDIETPVYPRSAIKPLQAIPVIESGAAARFEVDDAEIALACASHSGELQHVERVGAWLARIGLSEADLECGSQIPPDRAAAEALVRAGTAPSQLHNNCSGKHTGMLALALHLQVPTRGYIAADHPVQKAGAAVLAGMCDLDALETPAIDGCGIPTWPIPLTGLATAAARLADPSALEPSRAAACSRILAAMHAHPALVAGTGRACTAVMTAAPGVMVKTGAEGVYLAAVPARGLGLALKAEDGADRASETALVALLEALGALDDGAREKLAGLANPPVRNRVGKVVGEIRIAPASAEALAQ